MDEAPHCNWLKCRKPLGIEGRAVVTTCSHMFCVECASTLFGADKACPACETILEDPDSVILQQLSPPAEYRASVLAGLSPSAIMDITTRSLNFWHYQSSQEAAFQSMILKNSQERNTVLEKRSQSLLVDAKNEIALLQEKMLGLEDDLNTASRKNQELSEHLRTRNKEYENLKRQFDKNQRRALLPSPGHIQGQVNNQNVFSAQQREQEVVNPANEALFAKNPNSPRKGWRENIQAGGSQGQKQAAPFWQAQATRTSGGSSNNSHSTGKSAGSGDMEMNGNEMGNSVGIGTGRAPFNVGASSSRKTQNYEVDSTGREMRSGKQSGSGGKISRTHSHASSSTVHAQQAQAQQSRHRSQHQSGSHSNSQSRNAFDHQNRTPQANQSGTNFSYGLGGTGLINSNSGNHSIPRRSNNANAGSFRFATAQ